MTERNRRWFGAGNLESWASWATIFSLLIVVLQLVFQVWIQRSVTRVEELASSSRFRVTYPLEGGSVGSTAPVRGTTPYRDRNHYVVVTPMETGDNWVEEERAAVSSDGVWTGRARFGTAAVGVGQDFVVRALATRASVLSGQLAAPAIPPDAVFSEPTVVTRSK